MWHLPVFNYFWRVDFGQLLTWLNRAQNVVSGDRHGKWQAERIASTWSNSRQSRVMVQNDVGLHAADGWACKPCDWSTAGHRVGRLRANMETGLGVALIKTM